MIDDPGDLLRPDAPARLLADALARLEAGEDAADPSRARDVGEAAALLGAAPLAARAAALLAAATPAALTAGWITNRPPDAAGLDHLRRLRSVDAVADDHPPLDRASLAARAAWRPATDAAWRGEHARAMAEALAAPHAPGDTPLAVEVALTVAVAGDRARCEAWLDQGLIPPAWRHAAHLVLAIEHARAGDGDGARRHARRLPPDSTWHRVALALGLAGRAPWSIYPYADW